MSSPEPSSDASLQQRLSFIGLDEQHCSQIASLRPIVDGALPQALDAFYELLRKTPEVSRFFATEANIQHAKTAQLRHWQAISEGRFDSRYSENVRRIGEAHARIGLDPRWYIGGYGLIAESLVIAAVGALWPKRWASLGRKTSGAAVGAALGALVKAVFLDMDIAISVYSEAAERRRKEHEVALIQQRTESEAEQARARQEAEEARAKAEAEALANERASVVASIGEGLAKLAAQDLTYRIVGPLPDSYRKLQGDFNSAMERLSKVIERVASAVSMMQTGTSEISTAANDLSRRTEQQASSLEETASALGEITATVRRTAEMTKKASEVAASTRNASLDGAKTLGKAVEAMRKIEGSSEQIGQIISVIDEIAFQTNLLALNAGVEAARAGDAGRGFAVVASEVRALAQRSAEAAKEIKSLIATSTEQVREGVTLVADTGKAFSEIGSGVKSISDVVEVILKTADEEATGLHEINIAVGQLDQVTQQNAAMSEQASAASQSLAEQGARLGQTVGQFRFDRQDPLERELQAAAPHVFRNREEKASVRDDPPRSPASSRKAVRSAGAGGRSGRQAQAALADENDWTEF